MTRFLIILAQCLGASVILAVLLVLACLLANWVVVEVLT